MEATLTASAYGILRSLKCHVFGPTTVERRVQLSYRTDSSLAVSYLKSDHGITRGASRVSLAPVSTHNPPCSSPPSSMSSTEGWACEVSSLWSSAPVFVNKPTNPTRTIPRGQSCVVCTVKRVGSHDVNRVICGATFPTAKW